ncbi:hypothetical protein F5887DRAFT_538598 [Amanita rubescens]|nr:hypothetical protein F5887DRAFT_538598 [Amanita rubescens]
MLPGRSKSNPREPGSTGIGRNKTSLSFFLFITGLILSRFICSHISANTRNVSTKFRDNIPKTILHLLTNRLQKAIHYPHGDRLHILLHVGWCIAAVLVADCTFRDELLLGAWISYSNVCRFTIKSASGSGLKRRGDLTVRGLRIFCQHATRKYV